MVSFLFLLITIGFLVIYTEPGVPVVVGLESFLCHLTKRDTVGGSVDFAE